METQQRICVPYKAPERKREWERDHREQRNARRRALKLAAQKVVTPKRVPDPPASQPTSGWKDILGLAVGVGILIFGALTAADQ